MSIDARGQTPLAEVFAYQKVTDEQVAAMDAVRLAALDLATTMTRVVPECADRSAAIRRLREAVFTANAAISLHGAV